MTAPLPPDLPPAWAGEIASLGYQLTRWSAARAVLAVRHAKGRLNRALHEMLEACGSFPPDVALEVEIATADERWVVLDGGLSTSAAERALLHLPALRSFWTQELRQAHFDALRAHVPRAWFWNDTPVPSGAVIAGLGIAAWHDLPRKHDLRSFGVVNAAGVVRAATEADLAAAGGEVLVELPRVSARWRAHFARDAQSRVVLSRIEALS